MQSPQRAAGLLLLAAAAVACSTVREARRVQDPASAVPGERTPTAAELGLPRSGPVALDAVLRAAVRAHPSVVQARRAEEAARAAVTGAEAERLPQVSANAAASLRDQEGSPGGATRFRSAGFDVSWLLFDFGGRAASERAAGEQWLAAQADLRSAEVDVAAGVRAAWYDLQSRGELLGVARESLRRFEAHRDQVREFVRVGTRIPYDETKAELDVGNARLAEVRAADAVLAAEATLANAAGLAEVLEWEPAEDASPPALPPSFEAAWEGARRGQPALAAAAARAEAANALVDARVAALYPSVDLSAAWSCSGTSFPLPWSRQAGGALRWVPFDGFQNLSTIDQAVAGLRGARAARTRLEQQAWLDVRSAWLAAEDARQRLELTALTVRSAGENVELARGLFEVGKGTSIELADAEQALSEAQSGRVQARADLRAAAARLTRAMGAGVPDPMPGAEAGRRE